MKPISNIEIIRISSCELPHHPAYVACDLRQVREVCQLIGTENTVWSSEEIDALGKRAAAGEFDMHHAGYRITITPKYEASPAVPMQTPCAGEEITTPETTIHIAVVEHMSGMDVYADVTEEGLDRQVAAYCRDKWDTTSRAVSGCKRPPPDADKTCIERYFDDHENDSLTIHAAAVNTPTSYAQLSHRRREYGQLGRMAIDLPGLDREEKNQPAVEADFWGSSPRLQFICREYGDEESKVIVRYGANGKIQEVVIGLKDVLVTGDFDRSKVRDKDDTSDTPWEIERDTEPSCAVTMVHYPPHPRT